MHQIRKNVPISKATASNIPKIRRCKTKNNFIFIRVQFAFHFYYSNNVASKSIALDSSIAKVFKCGKIKATETTND